MSTTGGYNVICAGEDSEGEQFFLAHGFEEAFSERVINKRLVLIYNKERTERDLEHIRKAQSSTPYDLKSNFFLQSY